jgi:uncharacterized coiled-coil DUF342 family protein
MHTRFAIVLAALATLAVGCGKQASKPAPQAAAPVSELQRTADELARTVRWQSGRVETGLDEFASDLENTVRKSQDKLAEKVKQQRDELTSNVRRQRDELTGKAKQQRDELAEFAAEMAEDAKDRALDIPDVLDEFFGEAEPRRGDWRNRSGQRGGRQTR